MSRQNIKGWKDHPDKDLLRWDYYANPQPGEWLVRLDFHAWGKKTNLICYFTELGTGYCFLLNVWSKESYRPVEGGPAFDEEPTGGVFKVKVGQSRMGKAKFLSAERVFEAAEMETLCQLALRLDTTFLGGLYDEIAFLAYRREHPEQSSFATAEEAREAFDRTLAEMAPPEPAPVDLVHSGPVKGVFFWPSGAPPLASKTEPPVTHPLPSNTADLKSWEPDPGKPH